MNRRVKRLLPIAVLVLMIAGFLRAQDPGADLPPAPAGYVLDEARLFSRNPDRLVEIEEALGELAREHSFQFYFVLYDSLFGRSVAERAQVLQEAWLGQQPGIVLVLETDSGDFKIGQAMLQAEEIDARAKLPVRGAKELSSMDFTAILRSLEGPLKETPDRQAFAIALVHGLADGVSKVLSDRESAPLGNSRSRLIVLAIGLISAAGLLALLVVAGLKRAEARSMERYVFPKVHVAMRLGAPYGGGKISSRSFPVRGAGR